VESILSAMANEPTADDIATQLSTILINAFKERESRDPTNEEIEEMFDELTEERINEMLGLGGDAPEAEAEVAAEQEASKGSE
jgi:alcohol dehydrogenase class IV